MPGSSQRYLIIDGVRRCVSAREIGLPGLLGEVFSDGRLIGRESILLDQLVSPKAELHADRRYLGILQAQSSASDRVLLPPICVEEITENRSARFTPLHQVLLLT